LTRRYFFSFTRSLIDYDRDCLFVFFGGGEKFFQFVAVVYSQFIVYAAHQLLHVGAGVRHFFADLGIALAKQREAHDFVSSATKK